VLSIASVLLINGFFAISGAVGTPVIAGLEIPLDLAPDTVGSVYLYASLAILLSGFLVIFFIYRYLSKETGSSVTSSGWILYLAILVPYVLGSYFLRELTGIIASVIMAAFAYLFLFKERSFQWRPWLPYILLVLLLLLPKIFPRFGEMLSYEMNFSSIYGTGVNASLQPFRSPLIPFLASAAFALYRVKDFRVDLKPVVSKTVAVFLVLFPSLGITQLMLNSGQEMPSMVESLASVFVRTGNTYPVFSPLIGIIGAFITGSTTVSNIIFGSVQYNAALSLNMQPEIILGLQLAGASLGNAVCLFNIIAAAAVAGISNFKEILRKNLIPVLFTSLICTILGYGLIVLIGG
jgi:lactate permease